MPRSPSVEPAQRIAVALSEARSKQLLAAAAAHGFSPRLVSNFIISIIEAGLNIPTAQLVHEPTLDRFPLALPAKLVRDIDRRAVRLGVHRIQLIAQIMIAWLRAHADEIVVDPRILQADEKDRLRTSLRVTDITFHRLTKLAVERNLSFQFLVEDLLLAGMKTFSSLPKRQPERVPLSLRSQRRTISIFLLTNVRDQYTTAADRLNYPTRSDLIEEILERSVAGESFLKRIFRTAPDESGRTAESVAKNVNKNRRHVEKDA